MEMSDGMYDGYKEALEERARQWKLAHYGVKACYTCGKEGSLLSTDPHSFEKYKHVDHLSGEVPVRVKFCSQKCLDLNNAMLGMVKEMESFIGETSVHIFSPALRMTARELVEGVLRKSRRPNV